MAKLIQLPLPCVPCDLPVTRERLTLDDSRRERMQALIDRVQRRRAQLKAATAELGDFIREVRRNGTIHHDS